MKPCSTRFWPPPPPRTKLSLQIGTPSAPGRTNWKSLLESARKAHSKPSVNETLLDAVLAATASSNQAKSADRNPIGSGPHELEVTARIRSQGPQQAFRE